MDKIFKIYNNTNILTIFLCFPQNLFLTHNLIWLYYWQDKWRGLLKTCDSLDMFEQVSLMTLDILLKCIFGMTEGNVQLEGWVLKPAGNI